MERLNNIFWLKKLFLHFFQSNMCHRLLALLESEKGLLPEFLEELLRSPYELILKRKTTNKKNMWMANTTKCIANSYKHENMHRSEYSEKWNLKLYSISDPAWQKNVWLAISTPGKGEMHRTLLLSSLPSSDVHIQQFQLPLPTY